MYDWNNSVVATLHGVNDSPLVKPIFQFFKNTYWKIWQIFSLDEIITIVLFVGRVIRNQKNANGPQNIRLKNKNELSKYVSWKFFEIGSWYIYKLWRNNGIFNGQKSVFTTISSISYSYYFVACVSLSFLAFFYSKARVFFAKFSASINSPFLSTANLYTTRFFFNRL